MSGARFLGGRFLVTCLMFKRRFFVLPLLAPLLVGCGAVTSVKTAFEIPRAPTPSPQEIARAKKSRAFDSLGKSLAKLNAQTVQTIFGKSAIKTLNKPALRGPAPFTMNPALALANDLSRNANVPESPRQIAVSIPFASAIGQTQNPLFAANNTRTVPARSLGSRPIANTGNQTRETTRAFLAAWAARESLRRADEELLGRRTLEDFISLQMSGERPAVDLSLVSPEVQLELTNLRLQLLPLLSVPPARRAQAQQRIDAIEARLYQLWEGETARQNALLRQSLVEVPARLRREGESALALQTQQETARTKARLEQVERDLQTRARAPRRVPALKIVQRAATSPDAQKVRAQLFAPFARARRDASGVSMAPLPGTRDIARLGSATSPRTAQAVVAKNQRIWRAAVR